MPAISRVVGLLPSVRRAVATLGVLALAAAPASADQRIGVFSWQLAPFCNVITVEVFEVQGVYRLQGADDQCGAGLLAPAAGMAYGNRDGTLGFGLQIVTAPSGAAVYLTATLRRGDLGGRWRDSAGNAGDMLPPVARRAGGAPRPEPVFGGSLVQPADGPDRGLNVVVNSDTGTTGGDAAALFGQFGGDTGVAAPGNAGIRGDSPNAAGVMGISRSGTGVRGLADGGTGVDGFAASGAGVHGSSSTGTGVRASHERGGTALEIANGGLRVSGGVRPAFVHTTDGINTRGDQSCLDHPLANDAPNAIVLVTHRWVGGGNVPAVGVFYDWGGRRWCVFTEGGATMPTGAAFNVVVITQ